jgi:hypothetical protein
METKRYKKTNRSKAAGEASAVLAVLLSISGGVASAADLTDIWQDRRQPATHFSIAQQNDRMHLTLSSYDAAGNPVWYVAPNVKIYGYLNRGDSEPQFKGDVFLMRRGQIGIDFGETVSAPVGTIHVAARSATRLDIDVDINGVRTRNVVTRVTWRNDDFAEGYAISYFGRRISAPVYEGDKPKPIVSRYLGTASYEVADGKARMTIETNGRRCHYVGFHAPAGRIASIVGNFRCTDGAEGTFEMTEFSATANGFTTFLKTISADNSVTDSGSLGGGRNGLFQERIPDEEPSLNDTTTASATP